MTGDLVLELLHGGILASVVGGIFWLGAHDTRLRQAERALRQKIDRTEFDQVIVRLDDLHEDVREVRNRLRNGDHRE